MKEPAIDKTAVIKKGAVIVGDVQIGEGSSVWYNTVLRADVGRIEIGAHTNVQDCCVLHTAENGLLTIGNNVTVGHSCILHDCQVEDAALIGMGSIVMDGAKVGKGCIIGAGSLITQNTTIPADMLAFGRPAKVVRPLNEEEKAANLVSAAEYVRLAQKG